MLMVPCGLLVLSCSAANPQHSQTSFGSPEGPALFSTPSSAPTEYVVPAATEDKGEPKDKKRANTPPGMDRTGGGPASGAILDPEGAVTKQPVLREQESPR